MRYLPFLLVFALALYAFVDCLQSPRREVRHLPKPAWLVVILVPVVGALGWLLVGRPARGGARRAVRPAPVAPDDDPDFLRRMRTIDEEHEALLKQWERDLKRREREMKDDGDDSAPPAA